MTINLRNKKLDLIKKNENLELLYSELGFNIRKKRKLPSYIIDKTSKYNKQCHSWYLEYNPLRATKLCIGMVFYDPFLKILSVVYFNNNFLKNSLLNLTDFDIEWVMGLNKKRIEKHKSINELLSGDNYFGKRSLQSSIYIQDLGALSAHSVFEAVPGIDSAVSNLKWGSLFHFSKDDLISFEIENVTFKESINKLNFFR